MLNLLALIGLSMCEIKFLLLLQPYDVVTIFSFCWSLCFWVVHLGSWWWCKYVSHETVLLLAVKNYTTEKKREMLYSFSSCMRYSRRWSYRFLSGKKIASQNKIKVRGIFIIPYCTHKHQTATWLKESCNAWDGNWRSHGRDSFEKIYDVTG